MAKFIEIHINRNVRLINVDHIQEVGRCYDGSCEIYMDAVIPYDADSRDYVHDKIVPDECYEVMMRKISNATGGIAQWG